MDRTTNDPSAGGLDEFDARILDFEESAPRTMGRKEEAIRQKLGLNPVSYYQRLNELLGVPAAAAAHPGLVGRLTRLRNARADT